MDTVDRPRSFPSPAAEREAFGQAIDALISNLSEALSVVERVRIGQLGRNHLLRAAFAASWCVEDISNLVRDHQVGKWPRPQFSPVPQRK